MNDESVDPAQEDDNKRESRLQAGYLIAFCNLLVALTFIGSERVQRDRWVEQVEGGWPWYDEIIAQIYDDDLIDEFVEAQVDIGLSAEQLQALRQFRDALDEFHGALPAERLETEIIEMPGWARLRDDAIQVLSVCSSWVELNCEGGIDGYA